MRELVSLKKGIWESPLLLSSSPPPSPPLLCLPPPFPALSFSLHSCFLSPSPSFPLLYFLLDPASLLPSLPLPPRWTHNRKATVCKERRNLAPELHKFDTLIRDFLSLKLGGGKKEKEYFCCGEKGGKGKAGKGWRTKQVCWSRGVGW